MYVTMLKFLATQDLKYRRVKKGRMMSSTLTRVKDKGLDTLISGFTQ